MLRQMLHLISGSKPARPARRPLGVLIALLLMAIDISAQDESAAVALKLNQPVEREIRAGQSHSYRIEIAAGQYLQVLVEQLSVDMRARILTPSGQEWAEADNASGTQGVETLSGIIDVAGSFRLEVQPTDRDGAGKYRVKIEALRAPTEREASLHAAILLYMEATQLVDEGSKESLQRAIPKYEQALRLYRAAGSRLDEATLLNHIGKIYSLLREMPQALEYFTQAMHIYKEEGNRKGEIYATRGIADVYSALGEDKKALEFYEKVIPLMREVNDQRGEAFALIGLARAHHGLEDRQKALESYARARVLFRAVDDRLSEAKTLRDIGIVHDQSGEMSQALAHYTQAREIFRAEGELRSEGDTVLKIAALYENWGEFRKAFEHFDTARKLCHTAGDRPNEAAAYHGLALISDTLGEKQKALNFYTQALQLYRQLKDPREAIALANIGDLYRDIGDSQRAFVYYHQALPLSREAGNSFAEAAILEDIGDICVAWKQMEKARAFYQKALSIRRETDYREGEASLLDKIGRLHSCAGEEQKALEYYTQALAIQREVDDRLGESRTLTDIGQYYDCAGERQKALEFYNQALALSRAIGARHVEARVLLNMAYVARGQINLEKSLQLIEGAIQIIESLREQLDAKDMRATYFASVGGYYDFYVDLLMLLRLRPPNADYDVRAFLASERARARLFLETLTEARADIRQATDPALTERARLLRQRISVITQRQMKLANVNYTAEQFMALAREMETLRNELQQVEAQLRLTSPRYASLTQPPPPTLREIQTGLLDADTALLEYYLGEQGSYLWLVTQDAFRSFELPKRADIEDAALTFYSLLKDAGRWEMSKRGRRRGADLYVQAPASAVESAEVLSRMTLPPTALLAGKKRLLIVSDGALQYIPFGALPDPSATGRARSYQPLILKYEVVHLPSALSLLTLRREAKDTVRATKTLAVLADPVFDSTDKRISRRSAPLPNKDADTAGQRLPLSPALVSSAREAGGIDAEAGLQRLPGTRVEAERILALVPASERKQALDFAASRATATDPEIGHYRYIHIATHGFLNSVNPELSGIVLTLFNERGEPQDGYLQAHEVYNLKLSADLVVLSACQTGLGKEIKGEGLVGLTRGFMYAGAPRVVVSLWSVSDKATAELMTRFYRKLLKESRRPSAALREAQLSLLRDGRWAAPYYWAAFTLQGEWR